jgi:hypothetical protein
MIKQKRKCPIRVTDEFIHSFVRPNNFIIVQIDRPRVANDLAKIVITYKCKCSDVQMKTLWDKFKKLQTCNACKRNDQVEKVSAENGCKVVGIVQVLTNIYVDYICKCKIALNIVKRKQIHKFIRQPLCKECILEKNPILSDDDVRDRVTKMGYTYISHVRIRKNNRCKVIVDYICSCGNKDILKSIASQMNVSCPKCQNARIKATMMEKYGVAHAGLHPEMRKLIDKSKKETMIKRYGVEHSMQHAQTRQKQQKSAFNAKKYVFPSGRVVSYQGYEALAYNYLLNSSKIDENDIFTEDDISKHPDIPIFWYAYNEKQHRYYPDMCIWSQRKIIEVKSEYTAAYDPIKIELKRKSVIANGFKYELWIMNPKWAEPKIVIDSYKPESDAVNIHADVKQIHLTSNTQDIQPNTINVNSIETAPSLTSSNGVQDSNSTTETKSHTTMPALYPEKSFTCECGAIVLKKYISRHQRTTKHINYALTVHDKNIDSPQGPTSYISNVTARHDTTIRGMQPLVRSSPVKPSVDHVVDLTRKDQLPPHATIQSVDQAVAEALMPVATAVAPVPAPNAPTQTDSVTCECGTVVKKASLTAHKKTARHLKLIPVQ